MPVAPHQIKSADAKPVLYLLGLAGQFVRRKSGCNIWRLQQIAPEHDFLETASVKIEMGRVWEHIPMKNKKNDVAIQNPLVVAAPVDLEVC